MPRKRLTQIMPFLTPIRVWQRKQFYYIGMFFDKNKYCKTFKENLLKYPVSECKSFMINEESGYDILYQQNKVHNLKIISKTMNKVLIQPGETFSFCYISKNSRKYGKYKDGLVLIDDKIHPQKGGGICLLSNMLYYLFLMSPLTITERHGHRKKSLPNNDKDTLNGVDATINRGWLDLKVRNDTKNTYQLVITFDDDYIYLKLLSDKEFKDEYVIENENFKYFKKDDKIFESVSVIRTIRDRKTKKVKERNKLYDEVVEATYKIPKDAKVEEME